MSSNKIGIEVQVEFPTVTELQSQLAEKWKKVKNGFEGKINIAVDGHSLNKVKKQIQDSLDGKEFKIQLDSKLAIGEIAKVQKELKELDSKLEKAREIKINFNVGDMNKSMKEIIEANQKLQGESDKLGSKTKGQTDKLKEQLGVWDKISRKYKLINGKKVNTQVKTTYTDEQGKTTTQTRNRITGDVTEEQSFNALKKRKDALKEIENIYKDMWSTRNKMLKTDGDHLKFLKDEEKQQVKLLNQLSNDYAKKYNISPKADSTSLKEYDRIQKALLEIEKKKKEQADYDKEITAEQKKQAEDVKKLVSLEQQIHSIQMKQITALDSEQSSLSEQLKHYQRIQSEIKSRLTGENKLTAEQEEQLNNLRNINSLEQSRANEKKKQQQEESKLAREQREASQKMIADLKEIHSLRMRIEQITTRRDQGGKFGQKEQAELNLLQQQLRISSELAQQNRERFKQAGLLTEESAEQLAKLRQINTAELERVHNATKIQAENDKITAEAKKQQDAYSELLQVEQRISRLQRDMIFAGQRERSIIEEMVNSERDKAKQMTNQLKVAGQLTAERQREISKIREASRLEAKASSARQKAREKDQQFNDAGGLIDPYSTYANARQAFDAILQPMEEIDTAFYQVKKVADASDEALQNFRDTSFDVGTSLGSTASQYMEAVEKWVTAGKTFQESQELGQISQIGSFVGNINVEDMVKYMSVPLTAYEEAGLKAEDVINSMNEVANQNAIEMNDLGKAYVRSATTFKNSKGTFAELNGMITAAQEATRKGGERIGTGIKTIGLNISAIQSRFSKDNQKKYDFLESIGVDMEKSNGEVKSMTEVVETLHDKWDKLSKTDQANSVIMLAGKEHAETLQAIIDQWDTVKKVVGETNQQMNQGKDGSAYIEFAKQADSLRFKLKELRNMWDKLMVTIGESDGAMAGVLDALISGLNNLVKLSQNPAVMAMLKAIAGVMLIHAGANGVKRVWDVLSTGLKGQVKQVTDIALAWKNVRKDVDSATLAVGRFDLAERGAGSNGAPIVHTGSNNGTNGANGTSGGTVITGGLRNNTPYKDKDGNVLKDRQGNAIVNPHLDRPSDWRDRSGSELRDRNGNRIHDAENYDTRRYTDRHGNELLDRQGNAIVNPNASRPTANATQSVERTGGAIKGVTKALGKTLSLIPLLGDALLLLEITGVPVFDTIGKGIDKIFKSTSDKLAETENHIKKFKGSNDLINGTVDATRNNIEKLEGQLEDNGIVKTNKEGEAVYDKSGNLQSGDNTYFKDKEAFEKFKSDFNAEAENLGVDIRIKMNDTTEILNAMKELNKEKEKLEKKSQIDIVEEVSDGHKKVEDSREDVSKYKGKVERQEDTVAKSKETVDYALKTQGADSEAYKNAEKAFQSANDKLAKFKKELAESNDVWDSNKKAVINNAKALMSEGENLDVSTMNKKEAIETTTAMAVAYNDMKKESNDLADIEKAVANGKKLTSKQMEKVIALAPDYANVGKDEIKNDKNVKNGILDKIRTKQKEQDKTLETAKVAINASAEQAEAMGAEKGLVDEVSKSLDSKNGYIEEGTLKLSDYTDKQDKVKSDIGVTLKVASVIDKAFEWIYNLFTGKISASKTVSVHATSSAGEGRKGGLKSPNKSVSVGTTRGARSGRSSASVATGTAVRGAGKAVVSKATATAGTKERNNTRVSEDAWRYWNTEIKGANIEKAMRDLERAITVAKDDYTKVISLMTKKLTNLNSQISNNKTLLGQKDSQMNSVLNSLKKYGFKVSTKDNSISNLGHSKSLKGDKAEKAEELLQSFYSLNTEMLSIKDTIADLNGQILSTKDEIKEQKILKELKSFEAQLKRINALLTSVDNSNSLNETKLSLINAKDDELSLKINEEAMAKSKTNLSSLIKEFNSLSKATIGYEENGTELQSTLESLGSSILEQADKIIAYRQAINDLEFSRITEDITSFNTALEKQDTRLNNNIENLQEGLLSGTDLKDLASDKDIKLDLSRENEYEKQAQERINLEKEVQDAMVAFAKKNIDRAKGVANATLDINSKMYNQLIKMQKDYTNGNKTSAKKLKADYGDLDDIAEIDKSYAKVAKNLEKYFEDVQKKEADLTKKYNDEMAKAKTPLAQEALTNKFIMDNLAIEKQYYEASIKANNEAIKELNSQLSDASADDKQKILDQIAEYEQSNIDTQNKIKDTVKARFDFEKSLMDESIARTSEAYTSLQNTFDLLSSLGIGNYSGKVTILDSMKDVELIRNDQIKKNIADLQKQQALYEVGSYEWKIINDELAIYNSQLAESNKQLIEMNKSILANSFASTIEDLEKSLFGGKSHDAWQQHQQLWMEGLEKEIALEKMYKRMADLGTTVNKEKLDLLAEQEKLSKYEADRLNKQLDIIELQQKVDNLSKERTVQTLVQNEFGQWDWAYEADASQLEKAQDELAQAELELQKLDEQAKENYLTQLEKILSDAQNGNYESVEEFRDAMEDLQEAFDSAVGDIPEISEDYLEEMLDAYSKYITDNAGVVTDTPADNYLTTATATMTDALKKTFTDISKDLGEIFANALLAKMPSGTSVNANKSVASGSTAISIDKLEFPNVTNKDEIQDAILGLPQKALQKAKSKV